MKEENDHRIIDYTLRLEETASFPPWSPRTPTPCHYISLTLLMVIKLSTEVAPIYEQDKPLRQSKRKDFNHLWLSFLWSHLIMKFNFRKIRATSHSAPAASTYLMA